MRAPGETFLAQDRQVAIAIEAMSAMRIPGEDDPLALARLGDAGAHVLDHACRLVAEHDWHRIAKRAIDDFEVGVAESGGAAYPADGIGILFFPSGSSGPAFIATDNYSVIKQYNNSDAYALAVDLLADRLRGESPIHTAWPRDEHPISLRRGLRDRCIARTVRGFF
jgi:hypothetical protein